jgi:hypothetical protein
VTDRFAPARSIADALLYEGYVLYPYRASAAKNQARWQWGVIAPPSAATTAERTACATDVVIGPTIGGATPVLHVRLRFLQALRRTLRDAGGAPVDELDVGGTRWVSWDEAREHEIDMTPLPLLPPDRAHATLPVRLEPIEEVEELHGPDGSLVGTAVRVAAPVDASASVVAAWADEARTLLRVTVRVANTTDWATAHATREELVRHSLVGLHVVLAVDGGRFVSLLDPPGSAAAAVKGCRQDGLFPVLIGDDDVALASPIILYDHPAVAPESAGDLYDATEIDEILALRVLTMTDAEKAEARGTDRRAAAIVDRCDAMTPDAWARLHGTVRSIGTPIATGGDAAPWWDPGADAAVDPATDSVRIAGDTEVSAGARVRLRPSRRADAHDLFFAGMDATVAGVYHDVDGSTHVAVTLDDDPATEELAWQGRYLYFSPDELEPRPPTTAREV